MNEIELQNLLKKYKENRCTEVERELLEDWVSSLDFPEYRLSEAELQEDLSVLDAKLSIVRKRKYLWPKIAAAASIVFAVTIGIYNYYKTPIAAEHEKEYYANDIAPGKSSATLTLANGERIVLSDVGNGSIAENEGIKISKTKDDRLVYEIKGDKSIYQQNILSTTKGETYQVRLPDGTLVALNSASSLVYGTSYNKKGERYVELIGEAYFEVAKDPIHPFIVKTNRQKVSVLGTHFNISSYPEDKEIKTTLLEGKVKVISELFNASKILNPGQQSILNKQGLNITNNVDLEEAVAWKNGYFKFNGSLEEIMEKVSRWYDVEIIYQFKPDSSLAFGAEISMKRNISTLLKIIESTGNVKFKIDGRRVFVMK